MIGRPASPEERRDGHRAPDDIPRELPDADLDLSEIALPPRLPEEPEPTHASSQQQISAEHEPRQPSESAAAKDSGWSADDHRNPRPLPRLMHALGALNDWVMLRGAPILRNLPLLNRIPFGRGILGFTEIDFPKEDAERACRAVNKDTAAYIGVNHPEFLTDAMIDKAVARELSPLMAIWADKSIVNMHPLAQRFFLANNLVSNVRNGGGKEYSVRYAETGNGVLLHPEGMVAWTANKVHNLFPGIVDMAVDTALRINAAGRDRPVYIAPLVYKYTFEEDVSRAMHSEMRIIEKRNGLPLRSDLTLEERFFEMQRLLLQKREERFGMPAAVRSKPITPDSYFARQDALYAKLLSDVEDRHGARPFAGHRKIFSLMEAVRRSTNTTPEQKTEDLLRLEEARRLHEFSPDIYARESLKQEDIAECLKRTMRDTVKTTWLDKLRNFFPRPAGWRVAHLRAGEPIDVTKALKDAGGDSAALRSSLLERLRESLQSGLDRLNHDLHSVTERHARPNPFFTGIGKLNKH